MGERRIRTPETISFQRESDLGAVVPPPRPEAKRGRAMRRSRRRRVVARLRCLGIAEPFRGGNGRAAPATRRGPHTGEVRLSVTRLTNRAAFLPIPLSGRSGLGLFFPRAAIASGASRYTLTRQHSTFARRARHGRVAPLG